MGLAAIITYYKGGTRADGTEIIPNDAPEIMQLLKDLWATGDTRKVQKAYWQPKTYLGGTRRLEYRSRIDRHDYLLLKIHPRKRHAGNSKKVFFNSYDFKQADRTKGVFIRSALFIPHLMGNN